MRHNPCTVMLVFNFLESFLDIIVVLVGEKWGGGGGGQWWGRYTSINFLDGAGVLLVVQEKEGEGGKQPRKMMTLSKSLEKSLM